MEIGEGPFDKGDGTHGFACFDIEPDFAPVAKRPRAGGGAVLRLPRHIARGLAALRVEHRHGHAVGAAGKTVVAVDVPETSFRPVVEGHARDEAGVLNAVGARLMAELQAVLDAARFLDRPGDDARVEQPHEPAAQHADHPDATRQAEEAEPRGAHGGELVVPMKLTQAVKQRNQQREWQHHREETRHAHGVVDNDVDRPGAVVEEVAEIVVHLLHEQQADRGRKHEAEDFQPFAEDVAVEGLQRYGVKTGERRRGKAQSPPP